MKKRLNPLRDNIEFPFIDMILIGIYSGWRPQELAILKIADIDWTEKTFTAGLQQMPEGTERFPFIRLLRNWSEKIMIMQLV